ncbi:hypothetical protein GLOTRDRAFT_132391 [Gloeophyllum trabeum ATCC 11539]|uniref:DUF6534 domain-containing protein n=1 Tax=Gloeophyllum trabeum (strain ATCC 11539 / FP-39264 / Madison 617) TaxID=670483 RepID=S7PXN0_GLOTA|nr:uncharacterized protein GLOTRDRAFT_132391 [Gloeophyllum trabeum ATCC 11539]EPQ52273.1 hypothetical protein GLOTRDRAFT_132391 [Gloeophyllum trabeum ATCC 11539]
MSTLIIAPGQFELIVTSAGPQIIGFAFNWMLQGILTTQVYIYHLCFRKDSLYIQALVYGIFIFEWVQTGLITVDYFDAFIYHYGDIRALTSYYNTWFSVTIMCGVVAATVQSVFAWRIWVLSKSRIVPCLIVLLASAMVIISIVGGVKIKQITSATQAAAARPIITTWLCGSASIDVIIAVAMTILLLRAKSGIAESDAIIHRLIRLVVESGSLTAFFAVIFVIFFSVWPNTLLHECTALVLTKLYSNMLLTSFNNRIFVRGTGFPGTSSSRLAHTLSSGSEFSAPRHGALRDLNAVRINVAQETFAHDDIALQDAQEFKSQEKLPMAR